MWTTQKKSDLGIRICSVNVALETFKILQGWTSCREDVMTRINVFLHFFCINEYAVGTEFKLRYSKADHVLRFKMHNKVFIKMCVNK